MYKQLVSKLSPWWVFFAIAFVATINQRYSAGGFGFNYAHNALTLVAVGGSLFSFVLIKNTRLSHHFIVIASAIFLMYSPVLWTDSDFTAVVLRLLFILATLLWVFLLPEFETEKGELNILRSLLILTSAQAVYALILYFILNPTGIIYAGDNYQVTGIFMQRNVLASFLATGIALGGYLFCVDPSRWVRRLAATSLVLLPSVVVLINSKTGFVGLFVAIGLLLLGCNLMKHDKQKFIIGLVMLGLLIGFLLQYIDISLFSGSKRPFESHVSGTQSRLSFYVQSIWLINNNPLGVGFGHFAYAFMDSWINNLSPYLMGQSAHSNLFHPHNEILYLGVEGGVISILSVIILIIYVCKCAKNAHPMAPFLMKLSLLSPIAVHAMLEYPFYHSFLHWIIFIVLIRIFLGSSPSKGISDLYTVSIGVLLIVFSLTGMQTVRHLNFYRSSPSEYTDRLSNIVNPWVLKDEIKYAMQVTNLNAVNNLRIEEMIRSELNNAYQILPFIPQANLFTNMIQAHVLLGELDEANKLLEIVNAIYLKDLNRVGRPVELIEFDSE